ncbi:Diguanylate cyclase [Candidatus Accumulibacter aalborgensis]|uniref:diguanylate cyclase n=1 Tax=Candidatus Accumulibacter aalborgensis TaxID=1860102 RepID=A0A1A8XSJ5_9PROT|nr:GGDEF domain-containing protein [Candidatus Accumulibacter aalborgensis]SBT08060.1 Diguanylate cyclase [Candidatus Accumulibacter aalborgensis]
MADHTNPSEIARETLKQLIVRKLTPTPVNYQACYNEIAQLPNVAGFPEAQLRQMATTFPVRSPRQKQAIEQLEAAIGKRSWQGVQRALVALATVDTVGIANGTAAPTESANDQPPEISVELRVRLARLIETLLPLLGDQDASLSNQACDVLNALKDPFADQPGLLLLLSSFSQRASLAVEEQSEIKHTLLKLLHLIIENIGELSLDEQCVNGQIETLMRAVAPPITLRRLDDVERRLKDVIAIQRAARRRSLEAQAEIRQMLAAFINHLAAMNQSSTAFQTGLEESARQLAEVRAIEDLAPLLKQVIDATHAMAADTGHARAQIEHLQTRVLATNAELVRLNDDLRHASASARHDPLTDALNRRGLDEALAREIASVRRKNVPLSLSLLDVDNFKKLNDRLGHATGDEALIHLVKVVQQHMRPIDTLARYGGEEFVILMPDTALAHGIEAIKRLQRELTKSFFLTNNEKILITFSAGVAELTSEESGGDAIARADQAMYLAKRSGKNRVLGG